LHDDVVDESNLRRGQETVNAVWGNAASVLVGDFLYSRAFQMMVDADSMRIMDILAETTNTIAEGEVMQLMNLGDPNAGEDDYLEVIRCKTAKLFAAACQLGSVLAGSGRELETALEHYGMHLGTAFQLTDDLLDYTGDAGELGKNVGDDLAEGKPTLPLIRVMRVGSSQQQELIRDVIENGGLERLQEVVKAIQSTDALPYTEKRAIQAGEQAIASLDPLPDTDSKKALCDLARYAIRRRN
jgi:octaprenyl-diphosphate synthase